MDVRTATETEMEKEGTYNPEAARKNTLSLIEMTDMTRHPQEFRDKYPNTPTWILDAATALVDSFVDDQLDAVSYTELMRALKALGCERVRDQYPADKRYGDEYSAKMHAVTDPIDKLHLQMATKPSMAPSKTR